MSLTLFVFFFFFFQTTQFLFSTCTLSMYFYAKTRFHSPRWNARRFDGTVMTTEYNYGMQNWPPPLKDGRVRQDTSRLVPTYPTFVGWFLPDHDTQGDSHSRGRELLVLGVPETCSPRVCDRPGDKTCDTVLGRWVRGRRTSTIFLPSDTSVEEPTPCLGVHS